MAKYLVCQGSSRNLYFALILDGTIVAL